MFLKVSFFSLLYRNCFPISPLFFNGLFPQPRAFSNFFGRRKSIEEKRAGSCAKKRTQYCTKRTFFVSKILSEFSWGTFSRELQTTNAGNMPHACKKAAFLYDGKTNYIVQENEQLVAKLSVFCRPIAVFSSTWRLFQPAIWEEIFSAIKNCNSCKWPSS